MGFSRQEYWSGLPFPSPGDLPDLGIEPRSPALQADALPSELPGKPAFLRGSSYQIEIPTQTHFPRHNLIQAPYVQGKRCNLSQVCYPTLRDGCFLSCWPQSFKRPNPQPPTLLLYSNTHMHIQLQSHPKGNPEQLPKNCFLSHILCSENNVTQPPQKSVYINMHGFPGGASGKEPTCQVRRHKRCGFDPWVGKIPWKRKWQPTPVFLPGITWTEEPGELQSIGSQRVRHDWNNLTNRQMIKS